MLERLFLAEKESSNHKCFMILLSPSNVLMLLCFQAVLPFFDMS